MTLKFSKADSAGDKFVVTRDGVLLGYVIRTSEFVTKPTKHGGRSVTKVLRWKFQTAEGAMFTSKWETRQKAAELLAQAVDAAARGEKALAR